MILEIDAVSHRYGGEHAVAEVSFGLKQGELVALLGPSGCGKTTIIQAIAGHLRPTDGQIRLRGEPMTNKPPEARQIGIVFQQSTLYPHMTVEENIAYGLAPQDLTAAQRDQRITEYLRLVSLSDQRTAYPTELSGGQQRRVELARALAPQPDVLLLDEPLSALDRTLRGRLQDEIIRIQQETGITTLFVTHDQEEAMTLADRMVVMNDGRIAGTGTPRALYESPPNPFVAGFLGRSNTLTGTICKQTPLTVALGEQTVHLPEASIEGTTGTPVLCHLRPHHLTTAPADAATALSLSGEVIDVTDVGHQYEITIRATTGDRLVVEQTTAPPAVGDSLTVSCAAEDITLFRAEGNQ